MTTTYGLAFGEAERLLEQGLPCSVRTVREKVGSGSFSTICEAVRDAKRKHGLPGRAAKEVVEPSPAPGSATTADAVLALAQELQGVRKYFLLQVEEARGHAAGWKAKYEGLKAENARLETAYRQQAFTLKEEIAWLRGRAGLSMESRPIQAPHKAESAAPLPLREGLRYPGHPRAVGGPIDPADGAE